MVAAVLIATLAVACGQAQQLDSRPAHTVDRLSPSSATLWVDVPGPDPGPDPEPEPARAPEPERAPAPPQPRATAASTVYAAATIPFVDDWLDAAGIPPALRPAFAAIGACESHHNPAAVGDGGQSLGWLQLWRGWFRPGEDPYDPVVNAAVGLRVYQARGRFGGPGGWTCADILGIP